MIRKALLTAIVLASALEAASAQPSPPPRGGRPRVMSDTPEYCAELAGEAHSVMQQRFRVPAGAQMLAEEGQRLCQMGHVRPGIMRLRWAIRRLRDSP